MICLSHFQSPVYIKFDLRARIIQDLISRHHKTMSDSIVVLSGGTATNSLVPMLNSIASSVTYILPVLDNGGSTSEIIRVIGGPAIGDLRSRLTRLIPEENAALRELLSFRLDASPQVARLQWNELVDGSHSLWSHIGTSTKEIIRAFLVHVHMELLKRSRITASSVNNRQFRFELANVGNLFLTGVRLFIGSLDSAIELFLKITDISPNFQVLPCINTNFSYHIGAKLANGLLITGQSQISHPSITQGIYPPPISTTRPHSPTDGIELILDTMPNASNLTETSQTSDEELGNIPLYTHPELKKSQLYFSKTESIEPLLSPIKRVFYISPYGEEICPTAHARVTSAILNAHLVVYSIGSLMTSIVPIVILKGIGRAIAAEAHHTKNRILLLNGNEDRETYGMRAFDYIRILIELAQYSQGSCDNDLNEPWNKYVTHLFYINHPKIPVDIELISAKGIVCIEISGDSKESNRYDLLDLQSKLQAVHSQSNRTTF